MSEKPEVSTNIEQRFGGHWRWSVKHEGSVEYRASGTAADEEAAIQMVRTSLRQSKALAAKRQRTEVDAAHADGRGR